MSLVVHKYGGTSVGTVERIKAVAQRIARARSAGDQVVAVVSAMGHTTDELLKLAGAISTSPSRREIDQLLATGEEQSMALLALALHEIGVAAVSLTGSQAGIRTSGPYGKSWISGIRPIRLRRHLDAGKVVIVAGFQGQNRLDDITTLGRGGSDTTAVALAAALAAERCVIYTDVDGVYTADPRIVPEAVKLDRISHDEMAELAWRGAKVMHPRAIEVGKLYAVDIIVASSFNDHPGTLITSADPVPSPASTGNQAGRSDEVSPVENVKTISGIAYDLDVAKVTVAGVPATTSSLADIFGPLAEAEVSVDVIVVENAGGAPNTRTDVSFTVSEKELPAVEPIVRRAAEKLGASGVVLAGGYAKLSVVGTGMLNRPGYAARVFQALAAAKIAVEMVTTSEIQVTCVIARDKVNEAVRRVHRAFGLGKPVATTHAMTNNPAPSGAAVVASVGAAKTTGG